MKKIVLTILFLTPIILWSQENGTIKIEAKNTTTKSVQNLQYNNQKIEPIVKMRKGEIRSFASSQKEREKPSLPLPPPKEIISEKDIVQKVYEASNVKLKELLFQKINGANVDAAIKELRIKLSLITSELEKLDCHE